MTRRQFLRWSGSLGACAVAPAWVRGQSSLPPDQTAFIDDLEQRAVRYFVEQTHPQTGIVRGACRTDASDFPPERRPNGSVMVTGFGLAAWCIAAERGWMSRGEARRRVADTLRMFDHEAPEVRGWCYHWVDMATGRRAGPLGPGGIGSEVSSVDKAFFLAGALSAREYFRGDTEIAAMVNAIYGRVDFPWMQDPRSLQLRHGWTPETKFIADRWEVYSEASVLYLLGLASPTHPLAPQSWYAWKRNPNRYGHYEFIGTEPLFTYQYSHAFVDFRHRREHNGRGVDWFQNSVTATRAHRQFCLDLRREFPDYGPDLWGITTSDSVHGYVSWGGPPREPHIDGSIVPCAPGGSLMFAPDICVPALMTMRARFGDRIYGRYGFADAFNPRTGWVSRDVQGLDVGITLLAAENLRTGNVWRWFMAAPEVQRALQLAQIAAV